MYFSKLVQILFRMNYTIKTSFTSPNVSEITVFKIK